MTRVIGEMFGLDSQNQRSSPDRSRSSPRHISEVRGHALGLQKAGHAAAITGGGQEGALRRILRPRPTSSCAHIPTCRVAVLGVGRRGRHDRLHHRPGTSEPSGTPVPGGGVLLRPVSSVPLVLAGLTTNATLLIGNRTLDEVLWRTSHVGKDPNRGLLPLPWPAPAWPALACPLPRLRC